MSRMTRRAGRTCFADDGEPMDRDAMLAQLDEILAALDDAGVGEVLAEGIRVAQEQGLHSQDPQPAAPMSERRGRYRRMSEQDRQADAKVAAAATLYALKKNAERRRHEERQQRA